MTLLGSIRRRLAPGGRAAGPSRRDAPKYAGALLDEFHRFLVETFGERALSRDRFLSLFWRHVESGIIRPANRYVGDLWYLFAPDFPSRLADYYAGQELQLTMTFLAYAAQPTLLEDNYLAPYRAARQRFARPRVLEVGPGIPHGFVNEALERGGAWCADLTIVELDAIYARFTKWVCSTRGIPCRHQVVTAAVAPQIPDGPYDFIFAKDVFEHLDDPRAALTHLLGVAAPESLLALDLEDKGAVEYQHISPELCRLKGDVSAAGFVPTGASGNMSLYERRARR